jgi:thymidine kinase
MTHFGYNHHGRTSGWVEVICGGMFSGKTEELIRRVKRASIAKIAVQVFKPLMDDRYEATMVSSHSGLNHQAYRVTTAAEIRALITPSTEIVAIDEVQFFDEAIVDLIQQLADEGLRVICSGLDMDFRGEPFSYMSRLLATAESVEKLQAICLCCGAPATRTQRLINDSPAHYDDPIILIGAAEQYEARCRTCHVVPQTTRHVDSIQKVIQTC